MKNQELNTAFIYLSNCTGAGLSVNELKKLRSSRNAIKEKLDEYQEVRKSIWSSYGIVTDAELNEHEDKDEIILKIVELDNGETVIDGLNFLTEDKIIGCSPPQFNQNDLDKMMELLCAKSNFPNLP